MLLTETIVNSTSAIKKGSLCRPIKKLQKILPML